MEKVDGLPVDLGQELRELVQAGFLRTPVEAVAPVLGKLSQVGERDAAAEVSAVVGRRFRPAGIGESAAEVLEFGLRDVDAEGTDLGALRWVHEDDAKGY